MISLDCRRASMILREDSPPKRGSADSVIRPASASAVPNACLSATDRTRVRRGGSALASRPAAHRIVGVVVKTLILPESIDVRRNILCTCAEAAEFGDMLICDLKSRQ